MGTVTHFEVTADDPAALGEFHRAAFGWSSTPSPFVPNYSTLDTGAGDGIDGAVMTSDYQRQPVILWIEVTDVTATIAAVEAAGGRAVGEVNEIPGRALVVYIADPTGTIYWLTQPLG